MREQIAQSCIASQVHKCACKTNRLSIIILLCWTFFDLKHAKQLCARKLRTKYIHIYKTCTYNILKTNWIILHIPLRLTPCLMRLTRHQHAFSSSIEKDEFTVGKITKIISDKRQERTRTRTENALECGCCCWAGVISLGRRNGEEEEKKGGR